MKMIEHTHFICHFYSPIPVISHTILPYKTWRSGRSLKTSSASACKIISCRFHRPVPDLVYHQYGICRMYSEKDPQDFRLPVSGLYPWERVMLLLCAEAAFKPGGPLSWQLTSENLPQGFIPGRPSLAHKGSGYSIFRTELSVGVIGIYRVAPVHHPVMKPRTQ